MQANGPGLRVRAALAGAVGADGVVVVHDPLHPLASPQLVRAVVEGLAADPAAAACAPARPMTDTLKWLDEDEVVRGTADRETYRVLGSPQAYRRDALVDALSAAPDDVLRDRGTDVLPRLVLAGGARVALVRSPGESFRVQTEEDLVLVDALL